MPGLNSLVLDHGVAVSFLVMFAIFATRTLIVAGGASLWTECASFPRRRKVVLPAQHRQDVKRDMLRGLGILAFDASAFAALLHAGLIRAEVAPSPLHFWAVFAGYAV